MSDQPTQTTPESASEGTIYLARMPLAATRAKQPVERADLPDELLEHVHDRSVLEEGMPYLDRATASTNNVDSYYTRMLPSSLANYAEDARAGLSILASHNWRTLPMGLTYAGTYVTGPKARTEMDFYLPRGINVNGVNNDDVITAIRWGSVKDVSIGFQPGRVLCSIDKKEMFQNWRVYWEVDPEADHVDPELDCYHFPGEDYPKRDKKGNKLDSAEREMCVGDVDDAHCHELSLVYEGATPGAEMSGRRSYALDNALRLDEHEMLRPRTALLFQQRFQGVRFKGAQTRFFVPEGARVPTDRAVDPAAPATPTEETSMETVSPTDAQRAAAEPEAAATPAAAAPEARTEGESATPEPITETATEPVAGDPATVRALDPENIAATSLVDTFAPIRAALIESRQVPENWEGGVSDACEAIRAFSRAYQGEHAAAEFGRQARLRLIADVEKEGVRAHGAAWPKAAYRAVFEQGTYEEIAELRDSFRQAASVRYTGGRQTVEREVAAPQVTPKSAPNSAYKAG